jgi:uncharacterized SAM-binding protein YcdF (DUF218 family)
MPIMTAATDDITDLLDATAVGLAPADVVIVFGSTLPGPVAPAARVMRDGLAPMVALTGGRNRRIPEHVESEVHARLLEEDGVPRNQMIIEQESATTVGNVAHARPLIEAQLGQVRTVIAVVKWWHRRALHVLAAGMPSVERIYAVTWHPPARTTGIPYDRQTWATSADAERLHSEYHYFDGQLRRGELPTLDRDGNGWVRGVA